MDRPHGRKTMSESKELANRKLGEDVVGLVGGKENIDRKSVV